MSAPEVHVVVGADGALTTAIRTGNGMFTVTAAELIRVSAARALAREVRRVTRGE